MKHHGASRVYSLETPPFEAVLLCVANLENTFFFSANNKEQGAVL